jgi:hypothetical protein
VSVLRDRVKIAVHRVKVADVVLLCWRFVRTDIKGLGNEGPG